VDGLIQSQYSSEIRINANSKTLKRLETFCAAHSIGWHLVRGVLLSALGAGEPPKGAPTYPGSEKCGDDAAKS